MDIRNFFGGGGGKKSSSKADEKKKQPAEQEEAANSKTQNTASRRSPRRQKKTSTSSSQEHKTPTPERKKANGARNSPKNAKKSSQENKQEDSEEEDEDVVVTSTSRGRRKLNQTSPKGDERQSNESETVTITDTEQSKSEDWKEPVAKESTKSTTSGGPKSSKSSKQSSPRSTSQKSSPSRSPRQQKRKNEESPKKDVDGDDSQKPNATKRQKHAKSSNSDEADAINSHTDRVEAEQPEHGGAQSASTQPKSLSESQRNEDELLAATAEALPHTSKSGEALPVGEPNCLAGTTFVITGNLPTLERDEARDLILSYGGRVTTSVSKKTTHLLAGTTLETGQPVEESRKYKDASAKEIPIITEEKLFSMIREKTGSCPSSKTPDSGSSVSRGSESKRAPPTSTTKSHDSKVSTGDTTSDALWVDFHAPEKLGELIGNSGNVKKLQSWLEDWEQIHLKKNKPPPKSSMKENPGAKAALLSGPPGIGKSTAARLIARHCGYEPYEMNASDTRNKDAMKTKLAEVCGSTVLSFGHSNQNQQKQRRCIIMDEVDGMGSGDRGGSPELIKTIKNSRTPIICICNDRQKNNVRTLANHCYDLKFQRPPKATIAKRVTQLAHQHGLTVEENAMEYLVESVGNDIRQVLNVLQMWARKSKTMSFAQLKSRSSQIDKDSILRMTAFDAAGNLFNTASGPSAVPFYKRYEQFFVDYDLIPLQVQQAYPHSVKSPSNEKPESKLNRMRQAADAVCFSDMISQHIRGQQQWYLLPAMAVANVDAAFRSAGRIGFTGFPEWMGRNSTMNKHTRMLSELGVHMNSRVSGGLRALRLEYLEALRGELLKPLLTEGKEGIPKTIDILDEYGISKTDFTDNILDFRFPDTADPLKKLDTKTKTAFTRAYNAGSHTSQALRTREGLTAKKGKASAASPAANMEGDEEEAEEDSESDSEESDIDITQFQSKKRARQTPTKSTGAGASSSNGSAKKKAARKK